MTALLDQITGFFGSIGLQYSEGPIEGQTFLPGLAIERGSLAFDRASLKFPGDLLHEAGHLAVMCQARRRTAHRSVGKFAAEELAAIAWSYAAVVHLGLAPAVVFHPHGYKGGSDALIENFTNGQTMGVPLLQWLGMSAEPRRAAELGVAPYPAMIHWLNESGEDIVTARKRTAKATDHL